MEPEGAWSFANIVILKLYTEPDIDLLQMFSQVLAASLPFNDIFVCDMKAIHSVIVTFGPGRYKRGLD